MARRREKYFGNSLNIGDPSDEPLLLVPHATEFLANKPNYLYVGVAGNVSMVFSRMSENPITVSLSQGYHLFRPDAIRVAGTTAQQIIGFYDGIGKN